MAKKAFRHEPTPTSLNAQNAHKKSSDLELLASLRFAGVAGLGRRKANAVVLAECS